MRPTREPAGGTQSVERALSILCAFTDEHPVRRISELTQLTGLGQSTVSRLVGTLESLGFLAQDSHSGLYRIGPTVISLGGIGLNQSLLHQQARQIAQDLAFELLLGANVAERHGDKFFYLCHFEGRQLPRSITLVGRTGPLHATAIGKAMLFDMSNADIEALIGSQYDVYTPRTISTLDELLVVLETSRRRGYTTETEELALGRACIAAPIRDRTGQIVGALSIGGPLSAISVPGRQEELASRVLEATDRISTGLGYHGIPSPLSAPQPRAPMTSVSAD
jgi:DNA-binding IclR family transcriptional regulator